MVGLKPNYGYATAAWSTKGRTIISKLLPTVKQTSAKPSRSIGQKNKFNNSARRN
jgi:hypothetical protein